MEKSLISLVCQDNFDYSLIVELYKRVKNVRFQGVYNLAREISHPHEKKQQHKECIIKEVREELVKKHSSSSYYVYNSIPGIAKCKTFCKQGQ